MLLSALPTLLLVPPLNLVALACIGAALHRRLAGRVLLWLGLGGLILLALPLVAGTLLSGLESGFSLVPPDSDPPEAIVILSADEADIRPEAGESATVGHLTLERERAGAALARRTGLPILVTGGVIHPGAPSLAAMMSESLQQDFGLLPSWTETRSTTTWENAQDTAAILREAHIHSVYLVTHAWHMRRALIAFRAAGLQATAAPVAFDNPPSLAWQSLVPRVSAWGESYYALHEWIGCAWYAWRA